MLMWLVSLLCTVRSTYWGTGIKTPALNWASNKQQKQKSTNFYSTVVSNKPEEDENGQHWPKVLDLAWESEKGCPASSAADSPRELRQLYLFLPFPSPGRMEPTSPLIFALRLADERSCCCLCQTASQN